MQMKMKPTDTPRTNALLTELGVVKFATFEQIVRDTQRFADFARKLEREIQMLRAAIQQTLDENGHLADGDNCTLIVLKRTEDMFNTCACRITNLDGHCVAGGKIPT